MVPPNTSIAVDLGDVTIEPRRDVDGGVTISIVSDREHCEMRVANGAIEVVRHRR